MNKPLTVAKDDFTNDVIKTVNEAGLPAFIMADVLGDVLKELQRMAKEQLERDREAWAQELEKGLEPKEKPVENKKA